MRVSRMIVSGLLVATGLLILLIFLVIDRREVLHWLDIWKVASEPASIEWKGLVVKTVPGHVIVPSTAEHQIGVITAAPDSLGRTSGIFFIDTDAADRNPHMQLSRHCLTSDSCDAFAPDWNASVACIADDVQGRRFVACRPPTGPIQFYFVGTVEDWPFLSRVASAVIGPGDYP
jgi:hypothetical protein